MTTSRVRQQPDSRPPLLASEVQCLAWSPEGERLAGTGRHLTVRDVATGTPVASRELGSDATLGLGWTADAQHLTACSSTAIRVYSAGDAMLVDELSTTGRIPATDLAIQPDGHYRAAEAVARRLVYAVLTDDDRQETYTPAAFATKYGWKNDPSKVTESPQP
jgi:hypothetical protein